MQLSESSTIRIDRDPLLTPGVFTAENGIPRRES
jgi:hypothetical protein